MKREIKFDNIFIFISIIFLATLFILYLTRFIYYFSKEHSKKKIEEVIFSETLLKNKSEMKEVNDKYIFVGENPNNYVYYSGILFRIVSIEDGNIKLITDESITPLVMSFDDVDYNLTYVNKWLNKIEDEDYTGIFENMLIDKEKYLVKTNTCVDVTDDINSSLCDKYNSDYYVGLLSIDEYYNANAYESYLNNGDDFWLSNKSLNGNYWYVSLNGKLGDNTKTKTNYKAYGIRPTITIKSDAILVSGDGTKDNPYRIELNDNSILRNKYNGSYIKYSDNLWRIIENNNETAKLVLVSNEYDKDYFDLNSTNFSSSNINNYLNVFYETLDKEYLVEGTWYNGNYNEISNYDYRNIYTSSFNSYVGLQTIGDMYMYDVNDAFLLTPYNDTTIYTIKNNNLFIDLVSDNLNIRPVIYIKNLITVSGTGSYDDPFNIEGEV